MVLFAWYEQHFKKMDVAFNLPESEMPIPVRSVKRARENLKQFIEDLF